jgi:hypothetical protein
VIAGFNADAGRVLRDSPRAPAHALVALALLVLGAAACGSSDPAGSSPRAGAGGPAGGGSAAESGGSTSTSTDPAGALIADRVGDLDLEVVSYRLPDALGGVGGPQLEAMLGSLDLTSADVSVVMAVDRAGRLAIGRWELPGKDAEAILAAWEEAAGSGWQSALLGSEPALAGRGPDGRQAWAVARDGVFVYVVTDDPGLAAEAVAGTQ